MMDMVTLLLVIIGALTLSVKLMDLIDRIGR